MRPTPMYAALLALSLALSGCTSSTGGQEPATTSTPVVKSDGTRLPRDCDLYVPDGDVIGKTIECGWLRVPWDRGNPKSKTTDLAFVVLKATGDSPLPEPIIHVAGGPGASSTARETVLELAMRYAPLRAEHDIVLYDQRSTGRSVPKFECSGSADTVPPASRAATAKRLGRSPNPDEALAGMCDADWTAKGFPTSSLNTQESASDLKSLMDVLGYPGYDLYGVSYGTRVLMSLMHSYPEDPRTKAVVLDSVYPLPEDKVNDLGPGQYLAQQGLFEKVFDLCEADANCSSKYPDLRARYQRLSDKLRTAPISASGQQVGAEELAASMYPFSRDPAVIGHLPAMIAALEKGNTTVFDQVRSGTFTTPRTTALGDQPPNLAEVMDAFAECTPTGGEIPPDALAKLWGAPPDEIADTLDKTCTGGTAKKVSAIVRQSPRGTFNWVISRNLPDPNAGINLEMNARILCAEQAPFAPSLADVTAELTASKLPRNYVKTTLSAIEANGKGCEGWTWRMAKPTPTTFGQYPVLILSGAVDSITPPSFADIAAGVLPKAQIVSIPTATHSIMGNYGSCPSEITAAFLRDPGSKPDHSCTEGMKFEWQ